MSASAPPAAAASAAAAAAAGDANASTDASASTASTTTTTGGGTPAPPGPAPLPPAPAASYGLPACNPEWRFPGHVRGAKGLVLFGRSRAADATGFAIPALRLQLDAGVLPHATRPTHVLVTHTHGDHAKALPEVCSRRNPPVVAVPRPSARYVDRFLLKWQELNATARFTGVDWRKDTANTRGGVQWIRDHTTEGVRRGDSITGIGPGGAWSACVFEMDHSVPTVGYGLSKRSTRLREDLRGLKPEQIRDKRKAGEDVTETVDDKVFCYLLDTTVRCFDINPSILDFPIIIMECSFIDDAHRAEAVRTKHTLWADLKPLVELHRDIIFVLTHFSHRYSSTQIRRHFKQEAQPNVVIMLADDGRGDDLELQRSTANLGTGFTPEVPIATDDEPIPDIAATAGAAAAAAGADLDDDVVLVESEGAEATAPSAGKKEEETGAADARADDDEPPLRVSSEVLTRRAEQPLGGRR